MSDTRKIIRLPEGGWIEAQLTEEGVIVDEYDRMGDLVAAVGQTYEEMLETDPMNTDCKNCGRSAEDHFAGLCPTDGEEA